MNDNHTELIAAAYTPFDTAGELNTAAVPRLAQLFEANEVDGVFVGGSTGECSSLTLQERLTLSEHWQQATSNRALRMIVHVGHNCQRDAIQLAAHAEGLRIDGISAVAPNYFRPGTVEDLIAFLQPVAAAAPSTPFYYYHIPSITGIALPLPEIMRQARVAIPTLRGVKYSSMDLNELQRTMDVDDNFHIFYGSDETLLAAMSLGVRGAVGSTYNFAAPLFRRLIAAFDNGDLETAAAEQRQAVRVVHRLAAAGGYLGATKQLMQHLGVDCGVVRPPLANPTQAALTEIIRDLETWDVLTPAAQWQ